MTNIVLKIDKDNYKVPVVTKSSTAAAAEKIYNSILEGNTSAIEIAEVFKYFGEVETQIKKLSDENGSNSFISLVRDEITRNSDDGKSYVSKRNVKFELFEAGTKIDYSQAGDPLWLYYQEKLDSIKEKIKEREAYLKTIKKQTAPLSIVNDETGEVYDSIILFPCPKQSTSTYKQSLND